ncbi:hypothetical protein DD238_004594 [Peronospora effusa]|uniref:RxLR effector protein n=1 Tax=Peronospora effusa TaxID=542832 RepID=A0A3M6VHP7_9STRA|nr:hypothetical protein DD238_004594 [Peronospora effusa]
MHLRQFYLLVTLTFIACCTTFASAEDLIQDKSSRTNSQRKLTDESRRNLKGSIDEVTNEERLGPFNFESLSKSFTKVPGTTSQSWSQKSVNKVQAFLGLQKEKKSWNKKLWEQLKALGGFEKKYGKRKEFKEMVFRLLSAMGLKKKSRFDKFGDLVKKKFRSTQ